MGEAKWENAAITIIPIISQRGKEDYSNKNNYYAMGITVLHHYIQSASRLMQGITLLGCIAAPFLQDPLSERRFRLQEWEILS